MNEEHRTVRATYLEFSTGVANTLDISRIKKSKTDMIEVLMNCRNVDLLASTDFFFFLFFAFLPLSLSRYKLEYISVFFFGGTLTRNILENL